MTNKKVEERNRKAAAAASKARKETNDKLDRFSKLLAMAGRSEQYTNLAGDADMLLMMKSAVAYAAMADKIYGRGDMNPETKMGMCFLLGFVIGQNSVKDQPAEETKS